MHPLYSLLGVTVAVLFIGLPMWVIVITSVGSFALMKLADAAALIWPPEWTRSRR